MRKKVYFICIFLTILDIVSKLIIKNTLSLYQSVKIIPNFFNITYVENDGAAFSILRGKQLLLCIIAIIALFGIINYLKKEKLNNLKIIYYSLIISGIIGNLFDRIIYNYVIDFIDINIFNYQIPIFNLADSFICIGVFLIIIETIKGGLNGNRSK